MLAFGPTRLVTLRLDPADGRTRAMLGARGRVHTQAMDEGGMLVVTVELPADAVAEFEAHGIVAADQAAMVAE